VPRRDTSSSYLVELRKLTTQNREHEGEHHRVGKSGWEAGLTRADDATRPWWEGEEETWAESQEEGGGHEKVGLGEDETHSLGDETVHEEEHESMEEHGHLVGLSVLESDLFAVCGEKNTWAERQKKSGGDDNFLRCEVWEHLIYTDTIFCKVHEIVYICTPEHFLIEPIFHHASSEVLPNMTKTVFKPHGLFLVFPSHPRHSAVVFRKTKFDKVPVIP
jgi:hypothetical protein